MFKTNQFHHIEKEWIFKMAKGGAKIRKERSGL
jgi:hypothetical protein